MHETRYEYAAQSSYGHRLIIYGYHVQRTQNFSYKEGKRMAQIVALSDALQSHVDRLDGDDLFRLLAAVTSSVGNRAQLARGPDVEASKNLAVLHHQLQTALNEHRITLSAQRALHEAAYAYAG